MSHVNVVAYEVALASGQLIPGSWVLFCDGVLVAQASDKQMLLPYFDPANPGLMRQVGAPLPDVTFVG